MTSNIGNRLKRVDASGKVTGSLKFTADIPSDSVLYAAPIFSSKPHGIVKRIDESNVLNDPDFVALFTAKDIPGENQVGVIFEDQPLFADRRVRYVGDSVGLLIAKTHESAIRLSASVIVEIDELPPIYTIDESRDEAKNFIHDTNLACSHKVQRGDLTQAFDQADRIIEGSFTTPAQEHYYLEPQACLATPLANGGVHITGSIQCPFYVQKAISRALDIPFARIIVEQAPIGGAFGGKEDIPSEICTRAALAARALNQSVKMVYERRTDIQLTSKRHPFQMQYRIGVSREGKLIAGEILLEENAGAYATLSSVVSYRSAMQSMGPYVIPNISVKSNSYYTNLPPNGAFRGFGSPQAAFGHERIMDIIAHELSLDPVAFRLRNILKPDSLTLTGHLLKHSVGAEEVLIAADAAAREAEIEKPDDSCWETGYGIALIHYGNCLGAPGWHMDGSGVKIKIHRDGSISVAYGLVEMGQGALTVVTQMTAEALGVDPRRITILPTDTEQVPDSGPAVASRNVVMTGNAIRNAAKKLLPILAEAAGELLECGPDQIEIKNDVISSSQSDRVIQFDQLTDHLYLTNRKMEEIGWWHVPELEFDPDSGAGEAYFTYSYAAHAAQVRVNTLTGQVKVDKIWAAHDVGKAINPAGIEGQVEGGVAQGIGWALTENFRYQNGSVITDNLSTYLLPTALDMCEVETIIVESPEPEGPWGAKGIGEPAIIPTAAAITNAVSEALGKQVLAIPIKPEDVLALVDID